MLADFVTEQFTKQFGRKAAVLVRAPGRVNLLGAHVDYVEGWVLPGAIDRAVYLAAAPRSDATVTVHALDFNQSAAFAITAPQTPVSDPLWLNYPLGMAWALGQNGRSLTGMDVVMAGNVPIGAGVSSSAAVEMAFLLAWEALAGYELDDLTEARLGQQTENQFLGVGSGMMDQFASVHGRANHLILLDCRTFEHERIPLPPDTAVILADSGVRRQLAHSHYNDRPQECREAAAMLRHFLPEVQTLRDVSPEMLAKYSQFLPEPHRRRAQHAVGECGRVQAGAAALREGDVVTFGRLISESQASSRHNYDNSLPELDLLAEVAGSVDGCYGARFGGGGFGGFMQVLARRTAVDTLEAAMCEAFEREFGRIPNMFTCQIGDGATFEWL
jgi:galactokinase